MQKISERGINLIKEFESLSLKAYLCPAGVVTIGYGTTKNITMGMEITREQAEFRLKEDIEQWEKYVNNHLKVVVNQNQFDALVSYCYNTGGSETLFKLINENALDIYIQKWFTEHYITAKGKVLNGLVRRRKAECDLYFTPIL